jgi:hypothetical protein
VQGDVIGLVALDFILRLVRGGAVNVTFVIDGPSMHFDDFSAHPPGFRIPAHVIANLERLDHGSVLVRVSIKKLPTEAFVLFYVPRARPRHRRAAEEGDEIAAQYG